MTCITITFGDCSENHVGMEKNGYLALSGYDSADLDKIASNFQGKEIERFDLTEYIIDEPIAESNLNY